MDPERWQRTARLYESVLERDPASRAAFLNEATGSDDVLRRDVELLLARDNTPLVIDRPVLEAASAVLDAGAALNPGSQLGPYCIDEPLGEGGMGQVYRARDTRLNRTVAIKVLSPALAHDPQFRARFDREAHTVATLTHPNICTLYDIGHDGDVEFLVLEYLDGGTLAARLERGPLPFDLSLAFAIQIADALDAAHRHGIAHRDLKPGNIFLVRGGTATPTVKLLDFGLAKPAAPALVSIDASVALTTPPALTVQGTILGTFQYMAPEQLEGRDTDTRADIFAFGAVVHEMVTGRRAFEGNQASLIAAIMHIDPPALSTIQPLAPPLFDRIVRKCLAKNPEERWQSMRDVSSQLRWLLEAGTAATSLADGSARRIVPRWREALAWTLAVLGVAAALVAANWRRSAIPAENGQVIRATVLPPENWRLTGTQPPNRLAVSPDGRRLAFVATAPDGRRKIWIRSLDGASTEPLEGTDDGLSPFWSPDSRFVGFFAGGRLKKIEASGRGTEVTVCDVPGMTPGDTNSVTVRGTWNQNGVILLGANRMFYRVDSGGMLVPVGPDSGVFPFFLPDGTHFLYRDPFGPTQGLYVGQLDSHDRRLLLPGVTSQAVYAQGHLLYVRDQTLLAQRFDPNGLELSAGAVPLVKAVETGSGGNGAFSVSATGIIAYETPDDVAAPAQLLWFDRAGKQLGSIGSEADYRWLELSGKGDRLIASIAAGDNANDLWLFDVARGLPTRFTSSPGAKMSAVWSRDDERIVFAQENPQELGSKLYEKSADVIGDARQFVLPDGPELSMPFDFSRDGQSIIVGGSRIGASIFRLQGDHKPMPFVTTGTRANYARFSPDGQWIAYSWFESGRSDVYVAPVPGRTGKIVRVSLDGGNRPRWRRDGRELFFESNDRHLMSVDVHAVSGGLQVGIPTTLLQVRMKTSEYGWPYDVSPDGNRFLVNVPTLSTAPSISLLVNWPALLQKPELSAPR